MRSAAGPQTRRQRAASAAAGGMLGLTRPEETMSEIRLTTLAAAGG
jgi:hypothetical protein